MNHTCVLHCRAMFQQYYLKFLLPKIISNKCSVHWLGRPCLLPVTRVRFPLTQYTSFFLQIQLRCESQYKYNLTNQYSANKVIAQWLLLCSFKPAVVVRLSLGTCYFGFLFCIVFFLLFITSAQVGGCCSGSLFSYFLSFFFGERLFVFFVINLLS